jgi:hypothetical protein
MGVNSWCQYLDNNKETGHFHVKWKADIPNYESRVYQDAFADTSSLM